MKLFTQELLEKVPALYATEEESDPTVWVKLFYPDFSWTWYVIEFDGSDICFGLVDGYDQELGYFSLTELRNSRGTLGLPIERDRGFDPCKLSELRRALKR